MEKKLGQALDLERLAGQPFHILDKKKKKSAL
jgi:hypothetical protein